MSMATDAGVPDPEEIPVYGSDAWLHFLQKICPAQPPCPPPPPPVFTATGWVTSGDLPWFITDTGCAPGSSQCYHAGDDGIPGNLPEGEGKAEKPEKPADVEAIGNNQSTSLENTFTFSADGVFAYDLFCGSEQSWDFCRVLVDDVEVVAVSGLVNWETKRMQVSAGQTYTVKWVYTKDGTVSDAPDTMIIDNVVFTPNAAIVTVDFEP